MKKLTTKLNRKDIYIKKDAGSNQNICHAQMEYTQVGSTWFKPQHYSLNGYMLECVHQDDSDKITTGELKSYYTQWNKNLNDEVRLRQNLTSVMNRLDYTMAQELPMDWTEHHNSIWQAKGVMFGNGDYRYSGIIFRKR